MRDAESARWQPAPAGGGRIPLPPGEVHVWRAALERSAEEADRFWETLSADERERAGRFHFQKDRARNVAARGILRALLSRYEAGAAEDFRLVCNAHGKPALAGSAGQPLGIQFNLAHSRELAVFAFARGCAVGVDIEAVEENFPVLDAAPNICSEEELRRLQTLRGIGQARAFFAIWTAKEALLKARGDGFAGDPQKIRLALEDGETPRLLDFPPGAAASWSLHVFHAAAGFAAALAVDGKTGQASFFDYPAQPPPRAAAA